MYGYQSLQDYLFLMLYGGITMLALVAAVYLWLRRSNAIDPAITPPKVLRLWTGAFFMASAMSHIWWYVLGVYWLTDDRLVRNICVISLDHITIVPLVMALLLRLLQDRQRRIWPWIAIQLPVIGFAVVGIIQHDAFYGLDMMHYWQFAVTFVFVIYYAFAVMQYGRWLHDNYADLEHKEVWQSLLFVVFLFFVYEAYTSNAGELSREYLSQLITLIIIAFLLWRVETLQKLEIKENDAAIQTGADDIHGAIPSNFGPLLERRCEKSKLYLQHDLTLSQLAEAIGTNRTYLSQYFSQQGTTYNAYINRHRIAHFEQLYRKAVSAGQTVTAQQLAVESGFKSYRTFSAVFRQFEDQNVTTWMKNQTYELQNLQSELQNMQK